MELVVGGSGLLTAPRPTDTVTVITDAPAEEEQQTLVVEAVTEEPAVAPRRRTFRGRNADGRGRPSLFEKLQSRS